MLKNLRLLLIFTILLINLSMVSYAENDFAVIDEEYAIVSVHFEINPNSEYRLAVIKGDDKQYYPLVEADQNFSLPFGDGSYTVAVFKKVEGQSYKLCEKETFDVDVNGNAQFLASVYDIKWTPGDKIEKKAQELVQGASSTQEKVERIYAYVTNTISYDYSKVASISYGYIPNLKQTLSTKSGICYDYASLTAAMLRSVDVPTQLCMGYNSELSVYHSWNRVYIDGQWKIIDTTIDSVNDNTNTSDAIYKDESEYSTKKVF